MNEFDSYITDYLEKTANRINENQKRTVDGQYRSETKRLSGRNTRLKKKIFALKNWNEETKNKILQITKESRSNKKRIIRKVNKHGLTFRQRSTTDLTIGIDQDRVKNHLIAEKIVNDKEEPRSNLIYSQLTPDQIVL
jgi:predicted  nucleic acid-binding Zn-ribbon protein